MTWFYLALGVVQSFGLAFSAVGLYRVRRQRGWLRTSFFVSTPSWAMALLSTFILSWWR